MNAARILTLGKSYSKVLYAEVKENVVRDQKIEGETIFINGKWNINRPMFTCTLHANNYI